MDPNPGPVEQLALVEGNSYNGPMPEERILIVDDDREIVRLLRSYLERERYAVSVAYDGESALHALRRELPPLMLLDLMLPDRDGWEVTRTVRGDERLANTLIIMLTARVEDTDKIIGLELGADDYITKPFNPREVVARVRALLRRSQRRTARATTLVVGALQMDVERRNVQVRDTAVELTPTEFSLLQTLMESPGYVFTRTELMDRALGYDYSGVDRMLDSHIKNLRRKIEADPRKPQLVRTVYGIGYRLAGEQE
ncbi:MAG: response regulator transcription factor [Caldilineaceae bacterium]|nr:response regulator transcription factor [Caldilineaceae bacterium]MDE0339833.1 response regulator transcription factor [Caldilineaceae bacterium]